MAEEFVPLTRPPDAGFATQLVQPPGALYIAQEESLILGALCATPGERVIFNIRLLLADGQVQYLRHAITATSSVLPAYEILPMAEGFLLSVQAFHDGSQVVRGQLYVYVGLSRGQANGLNHMQTILADYVTLTYFPTWPNTSPAASDSGPGEMIVISAVNPGAGLDFSFVPTEGRRFRIVSVKVQIQASVAVANRYFRLAVNSGGTNAYLAVDATAVTAGQLVDIYAGPPQGAVIAVPGVHVVSLSGPSYVHAGTILSTAFVGLDAADQLQAISLYVERWL